MNIVSVVPFAKKMSKEVLTYFSKQEISIGDVVSIPLRKRIVRAIVISVNPLSESRSEIRKTDFSLRKIKTVHGPAFISKGFLDGIKLMADYLQIEAGEIFNVLLPKYFGELSNKFSTSTPPVEDTANTNVKTEILAFQASLPDRLSFYKTFIRESFAHKKSVIFCLPTEYDIEVFRESIEKGIAQYIYTLTGKKTEKQIIQTFSEINENPHPIVIFATPLYLFTPREDISTIIVEHESSPTYKQIGTPHVDARTFAEFFAEASKKKLIFADTLLRTETIWREREKIIGSIAPLNFRLSDILKPTIIDSSKTLQIKKGTYTIFAPEVKLIIKNALAENKSVFVFTLRKGLAPVTVCNNCGTSVICDTCKTPLTLHEQGKTKRIFSCPVCHTKKDPHTVCQECEGWDLKPLGIGADSVAEELEKHFPKKPILRIDKEHTKTKAQAQKVSSSFEKTPGRILVGTEMALFYLPKEIDVTIVASFDSLFSIPSFRIYERIMHLQMMLAERTKSSYLIQTKNNDEPILHALEGNNLIQFYQNEIAVRKEFNYPPFFRFIKISSVCVKDNLESERLKIEGLFEGFPLSFFKSNKLGVKGKQILHAVLKIPITSWPLFETPIIKRDPVLKDRLRSSPISWDIDIDPENVS